jgi:site-specific recombinase XerC
MAAERAELASVHPHTLRHSCGFYLPNRGYDLRLIQERFPKGADADRGFRLANGDEAIALAA